VVGEEDMAERSWFGWRKKKARGQGEKVVVDGSEIRELVEDEQAFGMLVEREFRMLGTDGDGRLNVRELRPAVADIGAALGLPAEGASCDTEHVYSEVRVLSCTCTAKHSTRRRGSDRYHSFSR
jgi:hypothetical protein